MPKCGAVLPVMFVLLTSILPGSPRSTLYGPDADDLWNRVHAAIWVRTAPDGASYAEDSLELPLILFSRAPLKGASYERLIAVLDEFNAQTAEELRGIPDLHKAIMQRALWAFFDWTVDVRLEFRREADMVFRPALKNLQGKLAQAIRLVAMEKEAIEALPDPYLIALESAAYQQQPENQEKVDPNQATEPFLPAGLNDGATRWAFVGLGKVHFEHFASRSVFLVAMRTPEGGISAEDYLKILYEFHPTWVPTEERSPSGATLSNGGIHNAGVIPNPETPQFPDGTQWALIRRAMLITTEGEIVLSPLVESIQLRAYLEVDKRALRQVMAEFLLSPMALLHGEPPLVAQTGEEVRYRGFMHHESADPFEDEEHWKSFSQRKNPARLNCYSCHSGWGIHGVNTRSELFSSRSVYPVSLYPPRDVEHFSGKLIREKMRLYDWGLLEGLWLTLD